MEYVLTPQLAGHSTKTYQFKLSNNANQLHPDRGAEETITALSGRHLIA